MRFVYNLNITMKNQINTINFTQYLNNCLKRDPSLKNSAHLKMGLTVNTFHANQKGKKHYRTKTDQICHPQSMSTTTVFVEGKIKNYGHDKSNNKKAHSQVQLKKANSYKILSSNTQFKSCSTYKSTTSKDSRQQTQTVKRIQNIRKNLLNKTNPELQIQTLNQELKQIAHNNKKNIAPGTLANQYYLINCQLLQTIKALQKKHQISLASQKQVYEKRQEKLFRKMKEIQMKNQSCNTLINQLRIRNVDVDGIWQQEKLTNRINQLTARR